VINDPPRRPARIGNASAFYGDRLTSPRTLIEGGPIDVVTGDYLAELTMLILWKAKQKDPESGWRYEFANQRALNFVVVGFLGEGVASCTRVDPHNKGLGEYLRAVCTDIPDKLLGAS
jgi:Acyclic terpene utilisation family protein AtuA